MIPLDLTHQVIATQDVQQGLLRKPAKHKDSAHSEVKAATLTLRAMLHDLLIFFGATYADVFGLTSGPPLHDPIAVAVLLIDACHDESLAFDDRGGERWHVDVVTDGQHSDRTDERGQVGRTRVRKAEAGQGGVRIPRGMDVKQFWEIIEGSVQRAEILLAEQYFARYFYRSDPRRGISDRFLIE